MGRDVAFGDRPPIPPAPPRGDKGKVSPCAAVAAIPSVGPEGLRKSYIAEDALATGKRGASRSLELGAALDL